MADEQKYNLTYSGSDVNTAVGRALNPDTTPTSGHTAKLVTSAGVAAKIEELNTNVGTQLTQIGLKVDQLEARIGNTLYYILDGTTTFTITNTLTNCSTNSSKPSAAYGTSYSATITANAGYTLSSVTVKMGGTDITSTAYSGGVISIASVTGDIVITATATADASAGLFDNASWFNGFWAIDKSANTATPSSSTSYLGTYFFGVPSKNFTVAPKTINGYKVAFRFYLCHSVNGTTASEVTQSGAYGLISGAIAQSVTTDTIKALDSSATYFAITIWAKATSGSGNLNLSNYTFDQLITAQ